jgi:hypothetical protein
VRYSRFGWQSRIKSRMMSSEVLFSRPRHAGSSATVERREPQRRDIRPVHPKAWPPRGLAPGGPDVAEMVPKDCAPEGGLRATFTDPTREPRDLGELELECQVCTRQKKVLHCRPDMSILHDFFRVAMRKAPTNKSSSERDANVESNNGRIRRII